MKLFEFVRRVDALGSFQWYGPRCVTVAFQSRLCRRPRRISSGWICVTMIVLQAELRKHEGAVDLGDRIDTFAQYLEGSQNLCINAA